MEPINNDPASQGGTPTFGQPGQTSQGNNVAAGGGDAAGGNAQGNATGNDGFMENLKTLVGNQFGFLGNEGESGQGTDDGNQSQEDVTLPDGSDLPGGNDVWKAKYEESIKQTAKLASENARFAKTVQGLQSKLGLPSGNDDAKGNAEASKPVAVPTNSPHVKSGQFDSNQWKKYMEDPTSHPLVSKLPKSPDGDGTVLYNGMYAAPEYVVQAEYLDAKISWLEHSMEMDQGQRQEAADIEQANKFGQQLDETSKKTITALFDEYIPCPKQDRETWEGLALQDVQVFVSKAMSEGKPLTTNLFNQAYSESIGKIRSLLANASSEQYTHNQVQAQKYSSLKGNTNGAAAGKDPAIDPSKMTQAEKMQYLEYYSRLALNK